MTEMQESDPSSNGNWLRFAGSTMCPEAAPAGLWLLNNCDRNTMASPWGARNQILSRFPTQFLEVQRLVRPFLVKRWYGIQGLHHCRRRCRRASER